MRWSNISRQRHIRAAGSTGFRRAGRSDLGTASSRRADDEPRVTSQPGARVDGMSHTDPHAPVHDRLARVVNQGMCEVSRGLPRFEPAGGRAGFQRLFLRVRPRCEAGKYRFFELRIMFHFINRNSVKGVAGRTENNHGTINARALQAG